MKREIDILQHLAAAGCLLVEKDTNRVWSQEETMTTREFQEADRVQSAEGVVDVSGPYPGCLQMSGARTEFDGYPLLGQTTHFYVFAQDPVSHPSLG